MTVDHPDFVALQHPEFMALHHYVETRCGLHFVDNKLPLLMKGIQLRMHGLGMKQIRDYQTRLMQDWEEFKQLVALVTINESYFFRERNQLQLYSRHLIPALLKHKKRGEKIRVLSAGCATGEEPYTLVMEVMEQFGASGRMLITVDGFDLDLESVHRAQTGIYSGNSFRGVSPEVRDRYFHYVDQPFGQYHIHNSIKEQVTFHVANLLDASALTPFHGVDIIFFRNVSIYFRPEMQQRVFRHLKSLLAPHGFLVMGSVEVLPHDLGMMHLLDLEGLFLFCRSDTPLVGKVRNRDPGIAALPAASSGVQPNKRLPTKPQNPKLSLVRSRLAKNKQSITRRLNLTKRERRSNSSMPTSIATVSEEADIETLVQNKAYKEAFRSLKAKSRSGSLSLQEQVLQANLLLILERITEAADVCRKILYEDRWHLEAMLLMGRIAVQENRDDEALKRFKEAVYVQPNCWAAHYFLAEVERRRGSHKVALRAYRTVVRLLESQGSEKSDMSLLSFSCGSEDVLGLCVRHIERLELPSKRPVRSLHATRSG